MLSTPEAPPKKFEHCQTVFAAMRRQAVSIAVPDGDTTRHALVYEGFTTKLFIELDLPTPYYTHVMQALRSMRCIVQLSRGGGGTPSRWELLSDPDLDTFTKIAEQDKQPSRLEIVEGQLRAVNRRVAGLEEQVGALIELQQGETKSA